ncbi:hypothetical protein [Nostoc sp.]|uniref:hypothetical protein n=1 Tax=Nostoc sp. TaxID=1180 RepID=UPI002FF61C99
MFEKSNLLLTLATGSRVPVAHGGNPQDRTGLATRNFTHLPYGTRKGRGLKTLFFDAFHGGGQC